MVPPRYRSTYFSHTFAGGYSAGYYSYIWSEVLDADTVDWFKANGGLTRENGDRFRAKLLSRGGSDEAMNLFRDFIGRDPKIEPLLKRRGLEERPWWRRVRRRPRTDPGMFLTHLECTMCGAHYEWRDAAESLPEMSATAFSALRSGGGRENFDAGGAGDAGEIALALSRSVAAAARGSSW